MKALNSKKYSGFIVSGLSVMPDTDTKDVFAIAAAELKRAGVSPARLRFSVYKRSVDARKKERIPLVYSVAARFDEPTCAKLPTGSKYRISALEDDTLEIVKGSVPVTAPPIVVGMGPAGLFCALLLAENGYAPVIIDRGDSIEVRSKKYKEFSQFGILDTESNKIAFSNFFGILPSLSNLNIPDFLPVPINVPIVSNKSDITSVNIVIIATTIPLSIVNNPLKSNFKNVGSIDGINE